jgi:VWFA-related protein
MVGRQIVLLLSAYALAFAQETPTFESQVNLVLVPVVVRDRQGRAIGNLTREDFRLLDNGAPQTIAAFSAIERPKAQRSAPQEKDADVATPQTEDEKDRPERYFIYLFDDVNTRFADMAHVREAAISHFRDHFAAGDRASIYTLSGKISLEFTSDRDKLLDTVSRLRWGQVAGRGGMQCPDVSHYVADLVVNKGDPLALGLRPPEELVKTIFM